MLIALTLVAGAALATPASAGVSFSFFYSNLNHDGQWLASASYGRVWQPALYQPGWNPYYDGHWVYTNFGWAWVSDYSWGSIPYHYGTWAFEPALGWVWVPGYVWAPSWVVFSSGPGYIGWAPVPAYYSIGASIGRSYCSPSHYVFVDSHHFLAPDVRRYAVPVSRNRGLVENTRIVNNIRVENQVVVNHGPSVRDVERWSGQRIAARPIERVPRVAASERFSRSELRVDSGRVSRGVRAAEPVATSRALPGRNRGDERVDTARGRRDDVAAPRATDRAPQSVSPSRGAGRQAEPKANSRPQPGRGNERVDTPRGRHDDVAAPRATDRAPQSASSSRGAAKAQPSARAAEEHQKNKAKANAQGKARGNGKDRGRGNQER